MEVAEILQLMEGMSKNRIDLLEHGDLKLVSSPRDRGNVPLAASGLMPPVAPSPHPGPVMTDDPVKAMAAAREAAARLADQRLALSQMRTQASRKRAAGGIGPKDTGSLVKAVFDASKPKTRR